MRVMISIEISIKHLRFLSLHFICRQTISSEIISLRADTHRALLAILSGISDIVPLVAVTAAADAVAASAANLDVPARRRDACAVGLLAVARLATPSRQAIAGTAFALAPSAADLKRTKKRRMANVMGYVQRRVICPTALINATAALARRQDCRVTSARIC